MSEESRRLYYFYQAITAGMALILSALGGIQVFVVGLIASVPVSLMAVLVAEALPGIGAHMLYGGLPDPESRGEILLQDDLNSVERSLREGDATQALRMLQGLLAGHPESLEVRFRMATIEESMGHRPSALKHYLRLYEDARRLGPHSMYFHESRRAIERIRKGIRASRKIPPARPESPGRPGISEKG